MPIYKLNGKTYNIPDDVVSRFEQDNPNATIAYSVGDKKYEIPLSKREGFLSAFPGATLDGVAKPKEQPTPANTGNNTDGNAGTTDFTMKESELEGKKKDGDKPILPALSPFLNDDEPLTEDIAKEIVLQKAYDERKRLKEQIELYDDYYNNNINPSLGWGSPSGYSNKPKYSPDFKYDAVKHSQLINTKRVIDKRIATLEESVNKDKSGFWRNLWRTVTTPSTWSFGLVDLSLGLEANELSSKVNNGEELTDEEQQLLQQMVLNQEAQEKYGGDKGFMARAGSITGEALPFVGEFFLTGGFSSVSHGVGKGVTKGIAKATATDLSKKGLRSWLVKSTGTVTGDVAAAGLMANTTGAAKTAADAMDRHRGQIIQDENGDYHFGHYEEDENGDMQFVDGGKSWARSIYEAEAANTLEYYTEMLGTHMEKPLGAVGSWIAEKTGMKQAGAYMISKLGLGEVSKDLSQITANGYGRAIKNVLERGGIQDYPSEVLEEEANIILNSMLVGDNSLSDLVDGRTQADIWGGMLFSVGFMQSPAVVAGGVQSAQYLKAKHQLENADKNAGYIMEDENWTPIRERIDATSNEEMADLVVELMNDDSITPTSKGYVMDYIGKLTKFRGFNVGSTAKAKDEVENPTDEGTATVIGGVNNSYMGGYEADEEQYNDLKNGYEFQRKRIGDVLTEEGIDRLDEDPIGTLEQFYLHDTVYSDEEKQTIYDYVNAKSAYEGMIARVRDDIDSRISLSNSTIDSRVHREDGMIHPATLTTDRKVYVVGGTVAMSEDGTMVDREATRAANGGDGMILAVDAESGKVEAVSVEEVLSVDEPIDAAKEKEIAQEAIRQEYAQKAANKIDGVLSFNNGDQFTVVDEQGAQHTVVVLPTGTVNSQGQVLQAGNDEVIVSFDGAEPAPMSRAAIQEMADNANLARLSQFEQEKAIQREAQAEAEHEASRPVYNINDEVTLQTEEGTVRGSITAEANEDGMIEVYTERPIGGKKINLYNRDELDRMVTEHNGAIQEPIDVETPDTAQETGGGVDNAGGEASPEQTGANDPSAATTEPMPMIGEGEEAEPDFTKATPERAHAYLYNESGLSRDEANQFIDANKKAADKALEKAKNAKPKIGTSIAKYKKEQSEYQQKVEAAEQVANYWQQVKDAQQKVLAAEAEERAKEQAVLTQQAIANEQQRQAEELQKREEQAQLGTHNVAPAIREKWEAANKVEGARNEIVLANGEKVPGKYILVESGAATPSHNPHQEFAKNEGFPVDENGQSVNDRDYERDKDAQATTRNIASIYDQRALQTPVVVTNDGIVLSGNGRTMAGELAAENNTDGAYIEHLKEYGNQFGFTPEQIGSMEHPRVVFVPDASMPYTADTFAKFNQQEMKGQSKTEQAVKLGKIVDDDTFGRIIRSINGYDTLADYYANPSATTEAINELRKAGAISEAQYAEMFDGDGISAQGREVLENMLIGKAFESNPDAVRQITSFKGVRQGVISALAEISNNLMLGEGYSHEAELAQAINLVYQARKSGYKSGEPVSGFARQMNLFDFDEGATVADFNNATVLMYADLLNEGKPSMLKKVLALYNQAAKDSANGQLDIFSGGVKTQEEILNDVKQILRHGTEKEQQEALAAAAAERIAASEQQPGVHENGTTGEVNQPSEADAAVAEESPVAAAEREVNTNPSDAQKEAGNYKKGHVKIDGYDISIENPKGSERSGTDANGHEWKQTMNNTYGYIRRTEGVDGDHIDVFLSDNPESGNVYVIDQRKTDGTFDEHKVMYGFNSAEEARNAYLSNYEEGWQGLGTITEVSKDEFKKWVDSSHRKTKPFAEYKSVNPISGQNETTEPKPVGISALGNLYNQFKGKAKEAIQFLLKNGEGDAVAALHHKDVGDIDLWYGNDKAGLKKIAEKHPEVLDNLQGIIDQMHVVTSSDNRIVLESDTHRAVVSKMLGNEKTDNWLLSAYEKKGTSASSSDIETEPKGKRNGTAAPQSPLSEGKGTEKSDNVQENNEKTSYSVTPKDYTTKRGKVLNMQLVKFGKELDKEQQRKANALAKKWAGWWSREDGGFMMRDEDSADLFARTVLDAEALENEQPISLSEMATATDMEQAVAPAEEVTAQPQQAEQQTQDEPAKSKWVDEEDAARFEELKRRMHKKMFGQLNMGVDPEILAIGTEMAFYVIKHGARKFGEYAKAMVDELGDAIRPYLKSFYNGARDFPEMEKFASDMSPYEEVRAFDVLSVGNDVQPTLLDKAEEITKEQEVEQQAIEAEEKLTEQRNDVRKAHEEHPDMRPVTEADLEASHPIVYYKGKPYGIIAVMHSGEQISATQFSKPHLDKVILTNGEGVTLDQLSMIDGDSWAKVAERADNAKQEREATEDRETVKKRKERLQSKKKNVSLQQELDLFGDLSGEDANNAEPSNSNNNDEGRENRPSSTGVSQRTPEGSERANSGRLDGNLQEGRNVERGNSGVSQAASGERSGSERPAGRIQELENTLRVPDGGESEPATTRPAGKLGGEGSRSAQFINPKNLRNNHAEQGKDYAPKSVDARIEANIKAIELMKQLIESGEQATPAQMAVLRQFSGWGGLGKAFENYTAYTNGKPTPQYLRELLGEEAYEQANMSRNSAYYTPAGVIEAMWNVARAMGFKGGNMLEGSAGIGNIIGLMPSDMSERSNIHAVEIDQTTGNILKLLYPDANVEVQGFEATQVENGSIDLAITNVPFVTGLRVNDTTGDKDLSKKFHDIHDFCIAKNIRKLREGGIGIFITSSGTLDNSAKLREWIIQEGGSDVVGAFRLNNETFGGTGATSDIIIVRKRVNGKKSPHAIDVLSVTGERTAEYDTGDMKKVKGEFVPVIKQLSMDYNSYFIEHPEHMAGEMLFGFEKGETFRPTSKALYPTKDKNQSDMLQSWTESFAGKDWESSLLGELPDGSVDVYEDLGEDVKEGSIVVNSGKLCIAQRGKAVPLDVNANKVKGHTKVECFEAYQCIKKAIAELLEYQTTTESDEGLQPLLKALNKAYDSFVKTYGHLHRNTSISFLKNDVDFANILALEKFSERPDITTGKRIQEYGKTDIFSQRVVEKEKAQEPKNVKDAIIASIYVHGRIDLPWMVEKLSGQTAEHSMTEQEIKDEIVASGLGFENPTTRQIEVSYEYLSGNVREKLRQAQENNTDGRYDTNIKALEAVIPASIPAHLIDFSIGSSWIDPKLYAEYVKEKTDIDVTFTAASGTWYMKAPSYVGEQKNRAMGITSEVLHRTIMGTQLIEAAMQNKTIEVKETRKKWDGSTETVVDKAATQACSNKIDEIRQDFKDWARAKMQSDPEMRDQIEHIYNEMFNNYVPKSIPDDFVPDHFGGAATMVDGKPFALRPHQGKAVVRGTTQPLLLAHEVGTGKTYTLISTAMEMRRLGTARKPMIVVQNATVGQFVESAKKLYPNAKVLTLEEKDHTSEGRKNFYAKIKYNDWDMIVVPQSVFERIPDSEERQMKFVQDKIEEKLLVLEQMKDADPNGQSMIVRQAEKEIDSLQEELAGLAGAVSDKRKERDEKKKAVTKQNAEVKALEMLDRQTDDVENFDDMGIDAILVDEAHEYKHLGFATAMQRGVKGVDPSYSKKAQGVFLKTQAVLEKNNGRNVIFATGTPISNTAAEIWTFMRYLMPSDTMKEYGIYFFDDFVRNFGNLQQMLEFTTSGKFKENNRFAGYVNLPELVRIWAGVADTVLTREAGGVNDKIPAMEGDKATDIYLPQTRALRSVMKFVKKELERFDKMSGKEKKENSHIPLTMYGIAKAAAVDARLVVTDAEDDPHSKTNEAVRQTLKTLKETESYKGTVAIFADNYQNKKSGFNLYEDIREKLIAKGVPTGQIVVMKSGMSVKKKLEIFDAVNRGEIRVIMGSTFTLGTGVNIQERLHTLIHLDAPNRPMDYTQRNGRILRQGNMHKEMGKPVRVLRFGVEDSLDVTAYQRLKTKGAIADSIMNGKQMMANSMENRALEEEEDVFGDTVAQLSGSEYAMLKNQAEKDVRKFEAKKKQYEADQTYCHGERPRLESDIKMWKDKLEESRKNLSTIEALPQPTTIKAGNHTFDSIDAMADFIKEYNKSIKEAENNLRDNPSINAETRRLTVNTGGLDFVFTTELRVDTMQNQGELFTAIRRKMTYTCKELGLNDITVFQSLLREGLEDIVKNVITGNDSREWIERSERNIAKCERSLEQVRERYGKPFEFTEELKKAHERLDEYSELMKKELEEKERKYAEMDADVEEAGDITEAEEADEEEDDDDGVHFRLREEAAPKKTGIGYKVFVLKDGKLYPPMVANPDGEATQTGVWLNADAAPVVATSKTGRSKVKAGGKGTQGGSGTLANRPGWHLGKIPYALQFNRGEKVDNPLGITNQKGEIIKVGKYFPGNFVWAEVEYADDVNYQEEAMSYGINEAGNFQHSLAGLPHIPTDGSYTYRTNANPATDPWIITGAMKVKRILKPSEVDELVKAACRKPQLREAGAVTDEQVEALNKEIQVHEIQERYDELAKRYNGKPYTIVTDIDKISDEEFAKAIGATDEVLAETTPEELHEQLQEIRDDAKKRKVSGGYSTESRKIVIFAENISHPSKTEEAFFHENIHGILHDWYENGIRTIADRFYQDAPKHGFFIEWDWVNEKYKDKPINERKEEFFVYSLSRAMTQGKAGELLDWLAEEDSERIENIINAIGYDRRTEEARRAEAEEQAQGDLGQDVSRLLPTSGRRRLRDGEGEVVGQTEEERRAESRRAGYSRRQYEAWREREYRRTVERVNYVIDSLHLRGRVMTYDSFDDVPKSLTSGMSQKRKRQASLAKGWYDEKTGQIVVILGNHGSVSDFIKTILHEGVAHYGLRKLFGKRFDDFLDAVYNLADTDVRRGIVELAKKHNWDFREATEEYLARLAEDTDFENAEKSGWWHKIKSLFLDMLHQLLDSSYVSLSNNELRYILWRSYMNMAAPGRYKNPFIEAEDIDMQMQLGAGRFANERRRIFGLGKIDDRALSVAESGSKQHFRDGDFSTRDRATARNAYERMVRSGAYQFREAVQDSMLGLKKLMEAILDGKTAKHTRIEDVAGNENAYLAENRMSSINAAEQHDYYLNFMKPLLDEVFAIAGKSNSARQALTDYMMAKHGLERNLVFAARDANEVAASGGDYDEAYSKFRERDYSGLTSLTGEKDTAVAEAAAQKIVDDYEAAYDTANLWDRVREATHATLDKIYRSGLLSKDRYERIRDMFEFYIPLQGWDETTSDEVYGYLTSKNGAFGSPIKHAEGRSSKADDPIATIGLMADTAISQGNRNQMKQRFLNFVLNNPSDLVSVHDLWLEYDAAEDEWKPVFADIEESDTAEDVERKVEAFEQHMTQLAEAEPDRYKRGSDAKNIPYKVVKGNLKEHQILVRRGGHTYVLTINGNPRAAQALNGLTNPDVETSGVVGNILKLGEYVNRNLSAFYTTRNPDFVVSNFFRDMLYSNCMTWVKESPRYALRYHKNFGRLNPAKMRILLGKWEKGILDMGNYTERMFHLFMMNGGETGYTSVRDIEAHKKEIAEELKKQGSTLLQAWSALGTQLDLLNRGVENCARFAAFVTSREMGRSIDRSIYDAKEVSVNFNKKGSGGKMVNANGQTLLGKVGSYVGGTGRLAYVFWNAGVQGLTNFGRAGKRNAGKAFAGASAMFILGYIIPQLAAAMGGGDGDDDDKNAYYNLPEYVRRTNICFRVGEQWITIPLPIEFRGLYGLGELASGVLSDNEHYDNKELSYQIASQVSQILPLDMLEGGGGVNAFIPSSMKPFAEAYVMNKSWTGLPIYKDTPWNQNDPEWTKAYKNVDQTLVDVSRRLNDVTGGDDFKKGAIDINPAKLEYLLSGVFGGYVNTAEKFKKMGETALGNREFDWRNMLLANRVVKSGDERTANRKLQNEYFKYRREYEETKRLLRKYEDAADEGIAGMAEKVDFLYNSPEYFRYEIFDEYKSDIDDYREDMQEAANEEERKEIEADMYATMRELIDQLHEVK